MSESTLTVSDIRHMTVVCYALPEDADGPVRLHDVVLRHLVVWLGFNRRPCQTKDVKMGLYT